MPRFVGPADALVLSRPRLEKKLDKCLSKRLALLTADAGFGKSTLLATCAGKWNAGWVELTNEERDLAAVAARVLAAIAAAGITPPKGARAFTDAVTGADDDGERTSAVASALCRSLADQLDAEFVLILEDVHNLGARVPAVQLIEALVRQAPPRLHIVLSSRSAPPFGTQRLRGQGQVVDITGAELAMTRGEVGALVGRTLDTDAEALGGALFALTSGWPAAVRLAIEALRDVSPADRMGAVERLRRADGPLLSYLAEEVFTRRDRRVRNLVASVAPLERFTIGLCEAIGLPRPEETVAQLEHRGFVVRRTADSIVLHALVRDFALECLPLSDDRRRDVVGRASEWYEAQGQPREALAAAMCAGDPGLVRRLLLERGEQLLNEQAFEAVLDAARSLPQGTRDHAIDQLLGEAYFKRGDFDMAANCLERAAGDSIELPARLAYLIGAVESERGRQDAALAAFRKGRIDLAATADEALLLASMVRPYWNLGDVSEARELAARALAAATAAHDPSALAAAHAALVVSSVGLEPHLVDDHIRRALAAAEEAGDTGTAVRMRLNTTHHLAPREALPEIDEALRLAEISSSRTNLAYALHRRGEVQYYLGRFDDAAVDLERARAINDQLGSTQASWNLMYLGDIARERGDLVRAKTAYNHSLRIARAGPDAQGLRGAQAGLALVIAAEDPRQARDVAAEAVAVARDSGHDLASALNAAGWVALHAGDRETASAYAAEAAESASRQAFEPHLAEAMELTGMSGPPEARLPQLEEAASIWRSLGNHLAQARNELVAARLRGERGAAARLARRLRAFGVRDRAAAAAGLLSCLPPEAPEPITIRTLGGFAVVREGVPVVTSEWRSRKARDLLKILIARRGLPTPRDVFFEALWPGEPPSALPRRLSVALSMLRAVLDPAKRFPPDQFVAADRAAISLRRANLAIDVEDFMSDVQAGLAGDDDRLLTAEQAYTGDFLEEDVYEDWSVGLREEARVHYIEVVRVLARKAAAAGDIDSAARYLFRILERDAYDETAHLELVTVLEGGGRHGEARRCYRAYEARMAEVGVEPVTYPVPSRS